MLPRFTRFLFGLLTVAALLAGAPVRAQDSANSKAVDVASDQGPRDAKKTELAADGDAAAADSPDSSADEERGGDENETFAATLVAPDPKVKASLEERLAGLAGAGLSEEERKAAADFYQQSLDAFALAEQQYAAAVELQAKLAAIPEDLAQAEAPLLPFADTTAVPLAELETWAANNEKWLKTYREAFAAREEWLDRRLQRLPELPKLIAQAQQQIKKLKAELAALGAVETAAAVTLAQMAALEQRCLALAATVQTLELEQRDYQERFELVQLERDRRTRKIKQKEDRLAQLRQEINQRREAEAKLQAQQAAEEAARQRPEAIAELARQNAELAEERTGVASSLTETTQLLAAAADRRATLEREFERAQEQDGVEELSDFIGHLLRQQEANLPNVRELKRRKAQRDAIRAEVQFRYFELQDLRAELADVDARKREIVARTGIGTTIVDLEVEELLKTQRDYLDALMKNYDDYLLNLANLAGEEATLIATTEEYADFIAERVLWIRSCQALKMDDAKSAGHALAWSFDPAHWRDAGKAVVAAAVWHPVQAVLAALGLAVLTALQRPARRQLLALGAEAAKRSCTKLRPTIQAVGLTAVVALPWPALLAVVAWSLDGPWNDSEFSRALSAAVWFAALSVLLLELVRSLCRGGGLADAHFDWPITCLVHLRRRLRWLVMLGLAPATWLVGLEVQSESSLYSSSLGRVLFIGVMLLLAAVHYRVLLARKSPFRQLVIGAARGWLAPVQVVWRPAAVLLPAALAVLAAAGYYYTAQQAALRVLQTSALLLAVLTLGGFTRRWLLVSRRRLAREQAKQRRLQLAAAHEPDSQEALVAEVIDEAVDLAALSEQTQKLVRTFLATLTAVGFIVIWGALLPAVSYLGAAPLAPGAVALTWGQLLAFLAILAVTYASVRDIPALMELVILQHLPLDSGSRYAITSVCRYLLTAIGAVAAFKCIGGSWDKIQWLVAAMSVGLGFGLQEIFANFVSGIILLFERPIRVGDVVTLGDKTGVVNRIRMRATTIIDHDRKEYIVPNKDLVTGRLLNWTLSDHTNRIMVNVSVANGSDTERACALLVEAAIEQPHVLRDPAPVAAFEAFGENGLNLSLRCFLPSLEHRLATIHNLHTTIDRKFRAAGIDGAHGDLRIRVARDGRHADAAAATMAFARQGAA